VARGRGKCSCQCDFERRHIRREIFKPVQERETKKTICMRRMIEGKMKESKTYN
jgi:hypothetical protein